MPEAILFKSFFFPEQYYISKVSQSRAFTSFKHKSTVEITPKSSNKNLYLITKPIAA